MSIGSSRKLYKTEYDAIKPEQKKFLALKRMKRSHQPGSKSSTNIGGKSNIIKLNHTITSLSKKVDALPRTEDASVKEESRTTPNPNHMNTDITCQKKKVLIHTRSYLNARVNP